VRTQCVDWKSPGTVLPNEFRRLFDALLLTTRHTITGLLAWPRQR
jgi:hypothetical protein